MTLERVLKTYFTEDIGEDAGAQGTVIVEDFATAYFRDNS